MIIEGDHYQVHVSDVPPKAVSTGAGWQDIDIRFLIGTATTGTQDATLWRARFAPGASHARHTHDAVELFYVLNGNGAGGTGEREYIVPAGSAVYVPARTVHWFRNPDPTEEVEIVGVYLPGGSLEEAGYHYVGEILDEYRQV